MSDTVNFNYVVKIGVGADILRSGRFAKAFPNCAQIVITSKAFPEYVDCEKSLGGLMTRLRYFEATLSKKPHVIVTKLNPTIEKSNKKQLDADSWDRHTIMRSYIAEAEALKESTLAYHVLGQINVDQVILGITQPE